METKWIGRVCPQCGQEISIEADELRKACNLEGKFVVRCPKCHKGRIEFQVQPPLTKAEVTKKALEV